MAVEPRLASAVMLLRDTASGQGIEVFMVRRVIQSDFMPDVFVFPGGSVSRDDRTTELTEGICKPVAPSAADPEGRTALGSGARAAAIRELYEEAGILLAYRAEKLLAISDQDIVHFETYRKAFHQRQGSLVELAHAEHLTLATNLLDYFAHWITPEGITVTCEQRRLTLSGERKPESAENGYHRRERPYGKFSRSIQLPVDLDIDHAEAKFNQGVMTLSIPQAAAAKPRQISVQAA